MSDARFEVVGVSGDRAYVRLVAASGEPLFSTEVFDSTTDAQRSVEDIVRTVGAVVEDHHQSGKPLFRMRGVRP